MTAAVGSTGFLGPEAARGDDWTNGVGSGLWSAPLNWLDGTEPTPIDTADFPTPIPFGVAAIGLAAGETALSVSFDDSYTLGGGTLAIAGIGAVGVVPGETATINSALVGAFGLTKLDGGTLVLGGTNAYVGDTTVGAGVLTFGLSHRYGFDLTVAGGARAVLSPRPAGMGARTLQVDGLALGAGGTLDLNDNDLVVDSGAFAPIQAAVFTGFDNPAGPGIVSSTSDGSQILALFDNTFIGATDWNGGTISAGAIVGKYTYFGDLNIDGQVTGDDYTVVDANLGTDPAVGVEWISGDANLDGVVTGDDYTVIDANLGLGAGNPLSAAAVPEPAIGVAALGVALLLGRRKRRGPAGNRGAS